MWTLQEAKNKFSAVVEAALNAQPQFVSRRGKPAVVVLSMQQYEMLKNNRKGQGDFVDFLLKIPQDNGGDLDVSERAKTSPREIDF